MTLRLTFIGTGDAFGADRRRRYTHLRVLFPSEARAFSSQLFGHQEVLGRIRRQTRHPHSHESGNVGDGG